MLEPINPQLRLGICITLMFSLFFSFGCQSKGKTSHGKKEAKSKHSKRRSWRRPIQARPVHVTLIQKGKIASLLTGTTTLEAEEKVTIITQVNGLIKQVYGKEGQYFRRGKLLASLRNPYLHLAYQKSRLQVLKLKSDLQRQQKLLKKGYVSKETEESLRFQLAQAQNQLRRNSQDLRNLKITATISGIVTHRYLRKGAWVTPNSKAFELEDPNSLIAKIALPEKNLPRLKKNHSVRLLAEALGKNEEITGTVLRISPTVDAKTGTLTVLIGNLKPLKKLRSGMFVTAQIMLEQRKDVPLVPKRAILYQANKPFVFRVKGTPKQCKVPSIKRTKKGKRKGSGKKSKVKKKSKCKAVQVFFKKGLENTSYIEALDNIKMDDRIIILGQEGLQNGISIVVAKTIAAQLKTP